ncbi:GyrI-like domain-containing protein [Rossellomorea aquimaris]|uniref:GyrI-like domain-containing protein n=1 Tax=Rossellomorea aquimaris TaxID=189382 RepID=UPI0011E8AD7C|nr:effector binding domain-containing protein [Rossellomorea aquimaris]TYS89775.1 AraC family transcriptional regulator [Rossellomorea aquimaris]
MNAEKMKKTFRIVGLKGEGAFTEFNTEVPKRAKHFLERLHEIESDHGPEIALYEPKRDTDHLDGIYYVGIMVDETLTNVPVGMEYIELDEEYVTTKGNVRHIGKLHNDLLKWMDDQGYKRKPDSYIVETYHPLETGEEEVEIYLPIYV